jgi:hypothetical protein
MNRRLVIGILVVLLLAVVGVTVGVFAYQAGVAQGLVTSGKVVIPDGGVGVVPYGYHMMPFYGGWGFGFGFVRCLFPLLGFFLLFSLLRLAFWRGGGWGRRGWGHGGYGGYGPSGSNVPPMFDEWHKRAHGEPAATPPESGQQSQPR